MSLPRETNEDPDEKEREVTRRRVRNEKKNEKKRTVRKEIEGGVGEWNGEEKRGEATNGVEKKKEKEKSISRENFGASPLPPARENSVNLVCLTSRLVDGLGPRKSFGLPRHAYDLPVVC